MSTKVFTGIATAALVATLAVIAFQVLEFYV
jgi:hypothetical protein